MKYYAYILYSQAKDRYYTGYSKNPEERVLEHNAGATPSTRPGIPWVLVHKEEFVDKASAIKRENAIKKMKSLSTHQTKNNLSPFSSLKREDGIYLPVLSLSCS